MQPVPRWFVRSAIGLVLAGGFLLAGWCVQASEAANVEVQVASGLAQQWEQTALTSLMQEIGREISLRSGVRLDLTLGQTAMTADDLKRGLLSGGTSAAMVPAQVFVRQSALFAAPSIPFYSVTEGRRARLWQQLAPLMAERLRELDLVLLAMVPCPPVVLAVRGDKAFSQSMAALRFGSNSAAGAAGRRFLEYVGSTSVALPDGARDLSAIAALIAEGQADWAFAEWPGVKDGAGREGGEISGETAGHSEILTTEAWQPLALVVVRNSAFSSVDGKDRQKLEHIMDAGAAGGTEGASSGTLPVGAWLRPFSASSQTSDRGIASIGTSGSEISTNKAGAGAVQLTPRGFGAGPSRELLQYFHAIGQRMADEWKVGAGADGWILVEQLGTKDKGAKP